MSQKPSSKPDARPIRVVLDTNVLISALLFRKQLELIMRLIDRNLVIPCFTISTFQELDTVLSRPKFKQAFAAASIAKEEILEFISSKSLLFADPQILPSVASDAADNFILGCGQVAQAAYLVTGDGALRALKKFGDTVIISPAEFLKMFSD